MHKSIKLATFNYTAHNTELGILESNFPSTIHSQIQSMAVSPKLKNPKESAVDDSELIEEDEESEPRQF